MGDTWHDACMPCGCVQPIKRGSVEEKKWRKRRKEERKRERKKDPTTSSYDFWLSDGRSSSGQELKSVYSMRATLQEVEILPTLVYFHLRGLVFGTDVGIEILDYGSGLPHGRVGPDEWHEYGMFVAWF